MSNMASVFNILNVSAPRELNDVDVLARTTAALQAGAPPAEVFNDLQKYYESLRRQIPRDIVAALLRGGLTPDTPVDGAACFLHHLLQQPAPPVCGSPYDSGSETSLEGLLRMGPDPSLRTATGGTALHKLVSRLLSGRYRITHNLDDLTMMGHPDPIARQGLYLQRAVLLMVQAGFSPTLRDNAGRSVVDMLRDAYCTCARADSSRQLMPYIRTTLELLGGNAPLLGPPGLGPRERVACDARMPFGRHGGQPLIELPESYLRWMCADRTEMWDPVETKVHLLRDLLLLGRLEVVWAPVVPPTPYDVLVWWFNKRGGTGGGGGGAEGSMGPWPGGERLAVQVKLDAPDMVLYDNVDGPSHDEGGSGAGGGGGMQQRGLGDEHGPEDAGAVEQVGAAAAGGSGAAAPGGVATMAAAAAAPPLAASSAQYATPSRADRDGIGGCMGALLVPATQAAAGPGAAAGGSGAHSGVGSPPGTQLANTLSLGSPPVALGTQTSTHSGGGSGRAGHVLSYDDALQLAVEVCNQQRGGMEAKEDEGGTECGQQPVMPFGMFKGLQLRQVPTHYMVWMCKHQQHPHFFESPMGREVLEGLLATRRVAMGADGRPHALL